MSPLQFAQEYVRELSEQQSLRAGTDFRDHPPDAASFGSVVQYAAAMRFALSEDVHLLNSTHLVLSAAFAHQLDAVPRLLARLYVQKMRILRSMSEIVGAVIDRRSLDSRSAAVEVARLSGTLESADQGLLQTSYLVFAALGDPSSDGHRQMNHLSIRCQDREMLRGELQAGFGKSLHAKNRTNLVAAAALLDNLLSRKSQCAG